MLNNLKKFVVQNKFNLAIFLLYSIVCFTAVFYHEIWRDEARVWNFLISFDLKPLADNIRFDGHPYLWYIILYPFAKMGFSVFSMQIIGALFCSAAVLFFLVKSPFNYLTKILFVFSAGMIYFLPAIARNYALVPLFVFILAYLYPNRYNKPYQYLTALILLSQTHCLMWGLFGICSFVFIIECILRYIKEKNKAFITVPFIIILYYIAMSFIYLDILYKNEWNPEIATSFFSFSLADISEAINIFSFLYENNDINKTVLIILAVLFVTICISLLKRSKRAVLFLVSSTFFMVYVMLKVWGGGVFYQKFFLIILVIIFCYWIADSKNDLLSKISDWILALFLLLLFFSPFFITTVKDDIQNTFTNTKEICKYINNKNIEKIMIITIEQECILSDTFTVYTNKELEHIVIPQKKTEKVILKSKDTETEDEYPKYIAVSSGVIVPDELPYKQVISAPKNRVKIYNTNEYYSLYEKTE